MVVLLMHTRIGHTMKTSMRGWICEWARVEPNLHEEHVGSLSERTLYARSVSILCNDIIATNGGTTPLKYVVQSLRCPLTASIGVHVNKSCKTLRVSTMHKNVSEIQCLAKNTRRACN